MRRPKYKLEPQREVRRQARRNVVMVGRRLFQVAERARPNRRPSAWERSREPSGAISATRRSRADNADGPARGVRGRMGQALSSDRTSLAPGLGARGTVLRVCVRHPQDDLHHNAVETLNRSLRTGPRARQSPPVSLWAGRCPKAGPRGIARPGGRTRRVTGPRK